ncbi:MAG: PaaI family thioesterase [Helicobacteraceae bacterium]
MADDENFAEEVEPDPAEYKDTAPNPEQLKSSALINQSIVGFLEEIAPGEATVKLVCTDDMVADQKGLIHTGFMFNSANYAALLAINEPNAITIVSKANFLLPAVLDDEVIFKARAMQTESRKRVVRVDGFLRDNKIFEAEFSIVVMDRHILGMNLSGI